MEMEGLIDEVHQNYSIDKDDKMWLYKDSTF